MYGRDGLANSIAFLQIEGQVLAETVGAWFAVLFWGIGAFSLFAAAMGIVDYTSRLAADVLKTTYLRDRDDHREPALLPGWSGDRRGRHRHPAGRASTSRWCCW